MSCASPGNDGWCRGGTSLELSANEPLSGKVIESIEGNPGGLLCDPADSASVACSYAGGGEGNFTIEFWALSSYGDTSEKASAEWKADGSPPSIDLRLSGGSAGNGGWYRGGTVDVSVSGTDGISGVAAAELSVNGGGWAGGAQVGGDGVYNVQARVVDRAGNESTDSIQIRIDGTPPTLIPELSGTQGRDGWYVSPVSVFASASDSLSGVSKIEVSDGVGEWQSGPLMISADGTYTPRYRAQDVAGNEKTADGPTIKIDTQPPESAFINPPNGSETWVSGVIPLIGQSSDRTSGLASVEISYDEGESWGVVERAGGNWQVSWDSSDLPNGTYVILVRATDVAGNLESTARITLRVDNVPPYVDIPDMWLVSETGKLTVEEGGIGLGGVEVVISSGENILLTTEYDGSSVPRAVNWNGRMPDGKLAGPGEYRVVATAWDRVGNRASDVGRIIVPEVELELVPAPLAPADTIQPRNLNSEPEIAISEAGIEQIRAQPWIWPAVAWIGLLSAVGVAKVSDPRAKALRSLSDDISMIRKSLEK